MLNDYEITRVDSKNKNTVNPILSLLKLVASSIAVLCFIMLLPDVLDEVYETRNNMIEDSLKIRVVANSNSNADQQFKTELVENLTPFFKEIQNSKDANVVNEEVYEDLIQYVNTYYPEENININYGEHLIPPKIALSTFYPQSYYQSLLITIGNGRWDNFWCSIFPKTCEKPAQDDTEQKDAKTEEEEETKVTFVIWEWIKSLFS